MASDVSWVSFEGMTNTRIDPSGIASPAANYAHAVKSTAANCLLHTSGILPVRPDGTVPSGIVEQARTVWSNISAILAEAEMELRDIVSVTTYVTPENDMAAVMAERDVAMAGNTAASTLVIVPALARPEWKMEISIVAAR